MHEDNFEDLRLEQLIAEYEAKPGARYSRSHQKWMAKFFTIPANDNLQKIVRIYANGTDICRPARYKVIRAARPTPRALK